MRKDDRSLATAGEVGNLAGQRAENLFGKGGLCCAESILLVVNRALGAGLADETAVALGSGFCGGVGEAGCVCGALAGAVIGLGLFLAPNLPEGLGKKQFRKISRQMHDLFHDQAGSACCRVLLKDFDGKSRARNTFCQGVTGLGARLVVELVLQERPDLLAGVDLGFLRRRDSKLVGLLQPVQ